MRIVANTKYILKNEFNNHFQKIKPQFDGNTTLTNSLAGLGTSGMVSFVGSITGMVMAGVGLVGAGAAIASVAGLASFGIVIATVVSAGRTTPTITAGTYATLATPFTSAVKGVKMIKNNKKKDSQPRVRPY